MINNENLIQKGFKWWLCVLTKSKHTTVVIFSVALEVFKRLRNIWVHFRQSSEVFGKSEIFGGRRDVSGNPSYNKVQPHALHSEKVGRYNIETWIIGKIKKDRIWITSVKTCNCFCNALISSHRMPACSERRVNLRWTS